MSPNGAAVTVTAVIVAACLAVLVFAMNFASADVWLLGFTFGIPLAGQWAICFAAGVVVALRIKHRQELNRLARREDSHSPRTAPEAAGVSVL